MSSGKDEEVLRVPCAPYGIATMYSKPRFSWDDSRDEGRSVCLEPHVMSCDELKEEFEGLFTGDVGGFRPARCPGGYLDFVRYSSPSRDWRFHRFERVKADVFRQILPDVDLWDVHYCEYSWYYGTDAPEKY
jgi:hypothetical protein